MTESSHLPRDTSTPFRMKNSMSIVSVFGAAFLLNAVYAHPRNVLNFRQEDTARTTFKAAVYAHLVYNPLNLHPVSRAKAVENMDVNLRTYQQQVEQAKKQGADIIVFPEDGIYGLSFSRDTLYPYLEQIPDPHQETWSPCDDPGRHPESDVQVRLSCLAKQYQIYLVANMGDKQPCDAESDPKCPKDGRYQFNTDVAYGPDGKLLAKYHKYNLYFERQFDTPPLSFAYFDTPFGRFGLMTCFDILFKEPGISLVTKYNVTNIAFPTAWMDALPPLPAIGFHSSFARRLDINVLAANIHLPGFKFDGTGLYAPDGAHALYYGIGMTGILPKLLVAEMDVIAGISRNIVVNNSIYNKSYRSAQTDIGSSASSSPSSNNNRNVLTNVAPNMAFGDGGDRFESTMFYDTYTFQTLDETSGHLNVCRGQLCCELYYQMASIRENGISTTTATRELFAFGVFDGLHTYHGNYYMQNCVLVKCADAKSRESCGEAASTSSTQFSKIYMRGTFQTPYVYPQLVLSDTQGQLQIPGPGVWDFRDSSLQTRENFNGTVLNAILIGRVYDRD